MANLDNLPTLEEHTDRYMTRVLKLCDGNVTQAAKTLGIGRATMYRWCEKKGLRLSEKQIQKRRLAYLSRETKTL